MKILITGAAGFIGAFTSKQFVEQGHEVIGIDNLNDYYDVSLKHGRLEWLNQLDGFQFIQVELADRAAVEAVFDNHEFDRVVHLAAQAGVRYSISNPHAYVDSNLIGFVNILEACRHNEIEHLVYASSSSVYGLNTHIPYSTSDRVDHPVSLYAATKKSNELMAHTYSHLYGLPTTGLRFFTVYGPWGRPDMAYFSFTRDILAGKTINVFNHGKMQRDFTYIDDIVEGVTRITQKIPQGVAGWTPESGDASRSSAPYKIYNIGNQFNEISMIKLVKIFDNLLKKKNKFKLIDYPKNYPADEPMRRCPNINKAIHDTKYYPKVSVKEGVYRVLKYNKLSV